MMIWPFKKKTLTLLPSEKKGWYQALDASSLLNTPLRQKLLAVIWQKVSMSQAMFEKLYQKPIEAYAELVQSLPASELHHHSSVGGMLDHTLEVISYAAKLRQSYLLPPGAAPEDQAKQAEAWTAVVIYGAILHDVGKIIVDIEIETEKYGEWFAWEQENLYQKRALYRFKYRKDRDYRLHPSLGGIFLNKILPPFILNWLAKYPEAFSSLLFLISGHYDKAGLLAEIIQRADSASVAQNLGGDIAKLQDKPQHSLPQQIILALRYLASNEFKLNAPGADGWLTDEALWLVSKNATDKVRAYLMRQGISVPTQNGRLFDEMQSHKLLEATPEGKAIWHCKIESEVWRPDISFTLLKFTPTTIWETLEQRPPVFDGKVLPQLQQNAAKQEVEVSNLVEPSTISSSPATGTAAKSESIAQNEMPGADNSYDFALSLLSIEPQEVKTSDVPENLNITALENKAPKTPEVDQNSVLQHNPYKDDEPNENRNQILESSSVSDTNQAEITAKNLICWIRHGLNTKHLSINSADAKLHLVQGKVFLVSPGIFQQFVLEKLGHKDKNVWRSLQNEFQRLRIHKKQPAIGNDSGLNIWTCTIAGPRKKSIVKGYLIEDTSLFFDSDNVPFDNFYLQLNEDKGAHDEHSDNTDNV